MEVLQAVDRDRLAALGRRDEFFWLDLRDPTPGDLETLGAELGLHPLALEDTHEWHQRPKVDPYDDHVFLVFHSVSSAAGAPRDRSMEVHLYVSGRFIVTVRRGACAELELLHGELAPSDGDEEDYLLYRILDSLTDAYFPFVESTEERIDALETQVLSRPRPDQLERIYRLKQEIHWFERRVYAQHEYFPHAVDAIMALPGFRRGTRNYLRDVGDHLAHVTAELHRQSLDLFALTETFFNANANKLNVLATRLSVVATFFVIGTLITGFFGQNFGWLVASIDSRTDFLIFGVGGIVVPVGALSVYFWRHRDSWM